MSTAVGPAARAGGAPEEPPAHWHADVVLADGGTVHLRPITPDDADAMVALHGRLSQRTLYLRFFGPYPTLPERDLRRFVTVDHHDRVALVATLGDDMIAVGRYERLDDGSAEVAFIVQDDQQGRGVGSILLEHLAAAARERGITRFVAEVLAENSQMVRVFRDAGYQVSREFDGGVLHLEFGIDPTRRSLEVAQAREQAAEARSVHNLLHARSVAVIGASADSSKIGHTVLRNLLRSDFAGPVYPVNPDARAVRGVRAYPTVADIPDEVDLAVVAVPAASVADVADECLAKGVKALLVISSGFGETGGDGVSAERRLAAEARAHGMRVVGPNALGVVNNAPDVRLNASLAPVLPGLGRVGFFCQSGALGITILAEAAQRGLGLSTFVSAGNRADVSGNDLLQYWQTDPGTDVVLLYLESFGNPRKFARLARRLARTKPVVAIKSGRHAGVAPGLAGTTVRVDEASVAALFEQAGVIRVESLAQLFDTALLLANQPLPRGPRLAVVGNSSALNLLVTDAALANGLVLAGEPVDVGAAASPEVFAGAVREHLAREDTDALVAVFLPPVEVPGAEYAAALRAAAEVAAGLGKPVLSSFLAVEGIPAELSVPGPDGTPGRGSVPSYPSPERAAIALARAVRYAAWRARPVGEFPTPAGMDPAAARDLALTVLADRLGPAEPTAGPTTEPAGKAAAAAVAEPVAGPVGKPAAEAIAEPVVERHAGPVREPATETIASPDMVRLSDERTVELLAAAGIRIVPFRRVCTVGDAVAAAAELGHPVAVKAVGEQWQHRTDLVGVRLDLLGEDAVRAAYDGLVELTGSPEVYVQCMAPKGISCAFALADDPSFGSLLSFGLHGVLGDLLGDRAYRAVPLSDVDAAELVRAPKAAPLLTGYHGATPVDLDALADLALRLSRLVEQVPQVRQLDLHPVLASAAGAFPTGAGVTIGPVPHFAGRLGPDTGPRRLR
ncbi:MAG TPA: GNAT family N-acetyltransferase [Pseudonocardiaceae bacterium]